MQSRLINQFFDRDPESLTLDDVRKFFSVRQEESAKVEFKSGDSEINDVFKEIAAFLNTEGGILIIGAPKESKETVGKRIIRYCQGEITFSKFLSKDWLHQKIYSYIVPAPINIYIKEIRAEEGCVFILDVPQSITPPHQSNSDGRYYIRIDNEAKPAPHGLVQALFDKRNKPLLTAQLERTSGKASEDSLHVVLKNGSNTPADKVAFIVDLYNVDGVCDDIRFDLIHDPFTGKKFSMMDRYQDVLVSVISTGPRFKVAHGNRKYIVSAHYWSRQTDHDCTYFIVDPVQDIIEAVHWLADGPTLVDRIRALAF